MAVNKEKNTQVLVTFPKDLLEQVDKYQNENNFVHRTEAIRDLIKKGLESVDNK